MFETLQPQPADKILALMAQYREDPRDTKIDLGVGVYKDATGLTPVMRAIKAAEHKLWEEQDSKSYVGLVGDPAFGDAMVKLVLADSVDPTQATELATVAADLPVHFLAIQSPQSPSDAGLMSAAKARGTELIVMSETAEDVIRANDLAQSKMLAATNEDGSERWQDAGYFLLPFIVLGAGCWSRKGWRC